MTQILPSVSIVIPIHKYSGIIDKVLDSLINQDFIGKYEIIVVVNSVLDDSFDDLKDKYKNIKFLTESCYLRSPYSSRNRGIELSNGDIIILLDSDCIPEASWLTEGVTCLTNNGLDIIAGKVVFLFENTIPTSAELWDSVTHVRQKESVEKGIARTTNLFVSRNVFKEQGLFKEGVRSGEDIRWTLSSTMSGAKLGYCDTAIVYKKARKLDALLKKVRRTGSGKRLTISPIRRVVRGVGMLLIPTNPLRVRSMIRNSYNKEITLRQLIKTWFVSWAVRFSHGLGLLFPGLFKVSD